MYSDKQYFSFITVFQVKAAFDLKECVPQVEVLNSGMTNKEFSPRTVVWS